MPHGVRAARLQHREEAVDIGAGVGARIDERVAHARLRGQVHDAVGAEGGEQRIERVVVRHDPARENAKRGVRPRSRPGAPRFRRTS